MRLLTMVMINKGAKQDVRVFLSDKYEFIKLSDTEIINEAKNKTSQFTNIQVTSKGIESKNGTFDRYGCYDTLNNVYIRPMAPVVLNRVEADGNLLGYTVFMPNGTVKELKVADAVKLHKMVKFANGKLKTTENGETISSIEGNYPLRTLSIKKEAELKFEVQPVMYRSILNKSSHTKYVMALFKFANAYSYNLCYEAIENDNKATVNSVYEVAGEKGKEYIERKELETVTSGNTIFTTISLETFIELWKKTANKNEVTALEKEIGCFDFSCKETQEVEESYIKLDKNNKTIFESLKTNGAKNEIVEYAKTLIKCFK